MKVYATWNGRANTITIYHGQDGKAHIERINLKTGQSTVWDSPDRTPEEWFNIQTKRWRDKAKIADAS